MRLNKPGDPAAWVLLSRSFKNLYRRMPQARIVEVLTVQTQSGYSLMRKHIYWVVAPRGFLALRVSATLMWSVWFCFHQSTTDRHELLRKTNNTIWHHLKTLSEVRSICNWPFELVRYSSSYGYTSVCRNYVSVFVSSCNSSLHHLRLTTFPMRKKLQVNRKTFFLENS